MLYAAALLSALLRLQSQTSLVISSEIVHCTLFFLSTYILCFCGLIGDDRTFAKPHGIILHQFGPRYFHFLGPKTIPAVLKVIHIFTSYTLVSQNFELDEQGLLHWTDRVPSHNAHCRVLVD